MDHALSPKTDSSAAQCGQGMPTASVSQGQQAAANQKQRDDLLKKKLAYYTDKDQWW